MSGAPHWPYEPDVPAEQSELREPSPRYYVASAALVVVIVATLAFCFYVGLKGGAPW